MAIAERAPVCEITRLPLPILPLELAKQRALFNSYESFGTFEDYHHPWFEEKSPELQDVYGYALRISYGQDINRVVHNWFTKRFSENGPVLPESPRDKIIPTLIACAGGVPRRAVFLPNNREHEIVDLTDDEHRFLSSVVHVDKHYHKRYHSIRRNIIGRAFAAYFLEQNIQDFVSKQEVNKFLSHKTSKERKYELGNQILMKTMQMSLTEFMPIHQEVSEEGCIPKDRARNLGKVVRCFLPKQSFPEYHDTLRKRLVEYV